jgi:hypothetical protein
MKNSRANGNKYSAAMKNRLVIFDRRNKHQMDWLGPQRNI